HREPSRVGFHTFVDLAQQLLGSAMAMLKDAFEHAANCDAVREMSEHPTEGQFVFDGVDEQRAMLAGLLRLPGLHPVALSPVTEGTLDLAVAEPLVPVEVLHECDPGHAHEGERGGAEAQRHARAST